MSLNHVHDLKDFYADPRGARVADVLKYHISRHINDFKNMRVMGLGYATSYLDLFSETERIFAAMPAQQGAILWPDSGPNRTILIDENNLPFETNSIDRIIAVHFLEMAQHPHDALNEIWRVLKSNGRLILIVPNRLGFWARAEWSPFGHGTPYSLTQLRSILRDAQFVFESSRSCLFTPPLRGKVFDRSALWCDKLGPYIFPAFAGLHMIEASKQLYASISGGHMARVKNTPQTSVVKPLPTPFDSGNGIKPQRP